MKKLITLLIILFLSLDSYSQKFTVGGEVLEITDKVELNIPYVNQTQQNWCWAACAAMVINFYEETNLTSCSVASQEFNYNCCSNPSPCDKQNSLDRFKFMVGKYDINTYDFENRVNWNTIKNQLDNDETMILRVESDYGGHFLIVYGYYVQYNHTTERTARMLKIYDPYLTYDRVHGKQDRFTINYERLLTGYGYEYVFNWTHTLRFKYWDN